MSRLVTSLLLLPLSLQNPSTPEERARMDAQNAELRLILTNAPKLPLEPRPIAAQLRPRDEDDHEVHEDVFPQTKVPSRSSWHILRELRGLLS